jgi:hypothetical protein
MSLLDLLQALNTRDPKRARQIAATKRWKLRNPERVKEQKRRASERRKARES